MAWHALGSSLNSSVYAIAVAGANVYVGGGFLNAGGNSNADHIARWDGSTWNALGSGLNDDVEAIVVAGANVYVGGSFTDVGGDPQADRIARWDGLAWHALGSGLNGIVNALAIAGPDVYAGGYFTGAGAGLPLFFGKLYAQPLGEVVETHKANVVAIVGVDAPRITQSDNQFHIRLSALSI